MSLLVCKFGGSSVVDPEHIFKVAKIICDLKQQNNRVVAVVSAMYGQTDALIGLSKSVSGQMQSIEMDMLLATGEQVSCALLSMAIKSLGVSTYPMHAPVAGIITDEVYGKARILNIDARMIESRLAKDEVVVVTGFQGVTHQGNTTTLGRGGTDTTAVALANVLKADECRMYKDVPGVLTADPKVEQNAAKLDCVSFEEMLEMASLGAKILHIRCVELARVHKVPLRILPLDGSGQGTLIIEEQESNMEKASVVAVICDTREVRITITGVPDKPGVAYALLGPLAQAHIIVDMIVQSNSSSDQKTDFTFTIAALEQSRCIEILKLNPLICDNEYDCELNVDEDVVKVSIVGSGMRNHAGVASIMFKTFADEGINIKTIATSEIKVSVLINKKYGELAVRALHKAFDLESL